MNWQELGLEESCPDCNGTKMVARPDYDGSNRQMYCPRCNATGRVPSALGYQLLEFVRDRSRHGDYRTRS